MSENQAPQPVVIVEKRGSGFAAFFWGAVVGAATALLFAPKSGEETQQELREGARRLKEGANEKLSEIRDSLGEGYERARDEVETRVETARDTIQDRRHKAEEALKAGKEAARRARTDLEQRVAESKAAYRSSLEDGSGSDEPSDEPDEESEAS